jgi:peptide deformylase
MPTSYRDSFPNANELGTIDPATHTPYIARMAIREIIVLPDKRLRLASEPVTSVDPDTRRLIEDMFETMYDAPGIGLAAIQVGVPKRIVTLDIAKKDDPKAPQVFLNPEVIWSSEEKATYEEGCLSIPEEYYEVERPAQVKVRYQDIDGKPHEIEASGLLATCLQHEIDHTNGVLFIDHISKLKRDRVIKKFAKAAKREKSKPAEADAPSRRIG